MSERKLIKVKTALLSVSDKTGLSGLATALVAHGCQLWSTGGTAQALRQLGHAVRDVSDITRFPEIMDGRVKTLHPKIHGALLSVIGNAEHDAARTQHGIGIIDLLVVNLYPFADAVARKLPRDDVIENIDIGGPAMLRAAAKNHSRVSVLCDPQDYEFFIGQLALHKGATTSELRQKLAAKAFAHTASYDVAVANWMSADIGEAMPETLLVSGRLAMPLRYGENPHQAAAAYHSSHGYGVLDAKQIQGKELSYNNINDADAALSAVSEFDGDETAACVIVKHANPCGVACGPSLLDAYRKALACDPVSAFGGIVAFNQPLDAATAVEIAKIFTEVIIAPGASDQAKALLEAKKNLRLLLMPRHAMVQRSTVSLKSIRGGFLLQSEDNKTEDFKSFQVVTKRQPTAAELRDLHFAWRVAKHVKSNAIVFARDQATVGIGAGQMSRIDSTRIAQRKSEDAARGLGQMDPLSRGAVLASDAFFPFPDGIEAAAEAGAVAIIQPGGAQRDNEVIAAADRHGLAMLFTGTRHFRH